MRIKKISVSGFRNIGDATIDLSGITALAAPNNFGKSNVVDAIVLGMSFLNMSPQERSRQFGLVRNMPLVPVLSREPYRFSVTFDDEDLEDYRHVEYSFAFLWERDDGTGARIIDETLTITPAGGTRGTAYLKRQDGRYRKEYGTRSWRRISLDGNQLAIDVLTAIDDIGINPVIRDIKRLKPCLYQDIDPAEIGRMRMSPIALVGGAGNGGFIDDPDFPHALYRLMREYPDRYEGFVADVLELFPEFRGLSVERYEIASSERDRLREMLGETEADSEGDVPFKVRDELYRIVVDSRWLNQPLDISYMSDGTSRAIWLVANTIFASIDGSALIAIEELETSVHPRLMKGLLEILDEERGSSPILVTSHSPYLVQYLKLESVYVGLGDDMGRASFGRVASDMERRFLEAARANGSAPGEYLFDLMSGDVDGQELLDMYLGGRDE